MFNIDNQASPERALWASVLTLAVKDDFAGRSVQADDTRNFLLGNSRWLHQVCDMAGVNPQWLQRKIHECMNNPSKTRRIYEIGKRIDIKGLAISKKKP